MEYNIFNYLEVINKFKTYIFAKKFAKKKKKSKKTSQKKELSTTYQNIIPKK